MTETLSLIMIIILFQDTAPSPQEVISVVPIIAAVISAVAIIIVGALTFYLNKKNFEKTQQHNEVTLDATRKHNEAALAETKRQNQANIEESRIYKKKEAIEKVLNEFYMPLHAYLQVTYSLGYLVKIGKPAKFRILTHLLEPEQLYKTESGEETKIILSESDKEVIGEIIRIEEEIEKIIATKTGLVYDSEFMTDYTPIAKWQDTKPDTKIGMIPHLIAHFRVFRMANNGNIKGEADRYKEFVFPRQLPNQLLEKINSLQKELNDLSLQHSTFLNVSQNRTKDLTE